MIGLTWERLALLLVVGVLVSAGIYVATEWLKRRLVEPWATHAARLVPTALGIATGAVFFPLALHLVGVTAELEYSAPYLAASAFVGFVGGATAKTSHEMVQFLRDYLPELIKKRT